MGHQNVVDIGFDVESISAEQKQVLNLFTELFGKLEQYDGTKFNPLGNGGLSDLKKSITDGATAMNGYKDAVTNYNKTVADQVQKQQQQKKGTDDLTQAEKIHQQTLETIVTTKAKISEADTNAANDKAIELQRLKSITTEVTANAKAYLSQIGSVNEARATLAQLKIERDKENASTAEGAARIQELNDLIDKNNKFINDNTSKIERQKNNVGNYIGAINILKESLGGIDQKLQSMAAAGDQSSEAFQKLTLEQKLLQGFLEKQSAGFTSVTTELRATKQALDTLSVAGLENTETFEKLNIVYTEAQQSVKKLHTEQAILTSESPALTALTATARGLGGAYALGAGSAAVFAEGNEKVEKELQKLVAIMTLLQGLEEAVKAIKDRGAIATALQATAVRALNAVRQVEVALFGEETAAVEAQTVAKELNNEATIANTAALEGNAAGAVINTEAMEATTAATEGAEVATISFRTALISTGIGAIIIGIIYGITKLVGAISDWVNADENVEKANKAVTASTAELLETTKELNEAYKFFGKERIEDLQKQADLQRDAGKNQFVTLEDERKINQARLDLAKKYVDSKKIDQATVDELNARQVTALEIVAGYEEDLRKAQVAVGEDDSKSNKKRVESLQKVLEQQKADAKNVVTQYNIAKDALKEVSDAEQSLNDGRVKTAKAAADELAKLSAEAAQRRYSAEKDAADRILGKDTSTELERLAALKSSFEAEKSLANSQIAATQQQVQRGIITQQEGASAIANIQTDLNLKYRKSLDDREKIRIEYHDRELNAQRQISKNTDEGDAAVQEAITKDVQRELEARLDALKKNISDRTKIIDEDFDLQIALAKEHGKTQGEIDAIESDRAKALVELTANTQKEIYDIVVSYGERRIKAVEDLNKADNNVNDVTGDFNKQTEDLNEGLIDRTTSYIHYVNEKRRLDREYQAEANAAQVDDDKNALKRIHNLQDELAAKLALAQADLINAQEGGDQKEIDNAQAKVDAIGAIQIKANADEVTANDKLNKDKKKQDDDAAKLAISAEQLLASKKRELAEATVNLGVELVKGAYEYRINQIENEIQKNDERANAEISAVQRSTLAQRDQATEIIILQGQQRARDIQLKNLEKQEKVKEAKFDRDVAAAKAIWNGAQAEIAALGEYAGTPYAFAIAAIIAALTAVEVATIYARPIPTYAEGIGIPGRGDHPGGYMIAGEAGPERVTFPGQKSFVVNKSTLMDAPAGTEVLPLANENLVFDLGGVAMSRANDWMNTYQPENSSREIVGAINQQTSRMERAFKKSQRKITNSIHVHIDLGWEDYLNKKVRGKG